MECLKFNLSGKTAFFKKPDVNKSVYFTYNNVHKISILGILGAIIGLKGHKGNGVQPEFYEVLHKLKVSIVPKGKNGYNVKKIQAFNNSTGLASNEEGGNLIVKEQWLENPSWDIFVIQGEVKSNIWEKIKDYLLNKKCIYLPYLGSNAHEAVISQCMLVEIESVSKSEKIDSLFMGEIDNLKSSMFSFIFTEYAPYSLDKQYNFYNLKRFIYTNCLVRENVPDLFAAKDKFLAFH